MKYKPIQGVKSKEKAEQFIEDNWDAYNSFEDHDGDVKYCYLASCGCLTYNCVSWVDAKVYLSNKDRMHEHESIYDIRKGYCRNPMVTGSIYRK